MENKKVFIYASIGAAIGGVAVWNMKKCVPCTIGGVAIGMLAGVIIYKATFK